MLTIEDKIQEIRGNFPVTKELIYFDHAAVAPIHKKTSQALNNYIEYFMKYGIRDYKIWAEKAQSIREKAADFIGAQSEEIAFIKNTSAGISIIANGVKFNNGDNVIIPDMEFPANVYPWMNLNRIGVETRFLKNRDGKIDLNDLDSLINKNTRLVSASWVEFSNGFRNDINGISKLCAEKSEKFGRKIYFCLDAIQGLGALKLDLRQIDIDFAVADGHKWFLALEGAGILYCNKKVIDEIHPSSVGWKSVTNPLDFTNIHFDLQPSANKFEEGSLNIAGILSLGASLDLLNEYGIQNIEKRVLGLTKYAEKLLLSKNIEIISPLEEKYRSGILSFKVNEIDKTFLKLLANKVQLSKRGDALRISPHFYNTEEEIERFAELI